MEVQSPRTKVLFLSDLDGTWLSKNPQKRAELDRGVVELKDQYSKRGIDLEFGYITARPPQRVASESLPAPDWTITDNGGFIHDGEACERLPDGTLKMKPPDPEWDRINAESGFLSEQTIARARMLATEPQYKNLSLHTVGEVVHSTDADACPYLSALCIDENSVSLTADEMRDDNHNGIPDIFENGSFDAPQQVEAFQADLRRQLETDGVKFGMSGAYPFSGKPIVMFDVSSPQADKGNAIEYLRQREAVRPDHVIVAGDGGNDISMMRAQDGKDEGRRAIAVGGGSELYNAAKQLKNAILQPADMDSAEAVLDGLKKHLEDIAKDVGTHAA